MTLNTATLNLAQQTQSPSLTAFSKLIAIITEPLFLMTLATTISAILYIKNQKYKAILLFSTTAITSILVKYLKITLNVPRPTSMLVLETTSSLPAGHTTLAVVFFGLLTYIFATKQNKIPATIASILIILTVLTVITLLILMAKTSLIVKAKRRQKKYLDAKLSGRKPKCNDCNCRR